jgi:hypothetical protein
MEFMRWGDADRRRNREGKKEGKKEGERGRYRQ